jgi:RNAse (barnase) inhibitor barstar
MGAPSAKIEGKNIHDWNSLHDEFQRVFGFPAFYGRNMDAWIDCMSSLDDREAGLSSVHVEPGEVMHLQIADADSLKRNCQEQFDAIIECAGFVNLRRLEQGLPGILALAFHVGTQNSTSTAETARSAPTPPLSFKEMLRSMPNVGDDSDIERKQ